MAVKSAKHPPMQVVGTETLRSNKSTYDVQQAFTTTRKEMNASLIERPEEIDLALTAIVCRQHLLLIGAPGTAKSLIAETLRKWIINTRALTIHCNKDTTRNVAFGPIKLSALKMDRVERALEGGAADAHILILEEVFKAGPAVLDMFLMLMNERVYKEGLVQTNAPLRFILGVSNEWSPEGCEVALGAFFDRFLIRKQVECIQSPDGIARLLMIPTAAYPHIARSHEPQLSTSVTLDDIDTAYNSARTLVYSDEAAEAFVKIRNQLVKDGIFPGDRRLKLAVGAVQAYAWIQGAKRVEMDHLEVLAHILWDVPGEQPKKAAKIVARIANPTGMTINDLCQQADAIVITETSPADSVEKLKIIQINLVRLPNHPLRDPAVAKVSEYIKQAGYRATGIK